MTLIIQLTPKEVFLPCNYYDARVNILTEQHKDEVLYLVPTVVQVAKLSMASLGSTSLQCTSPTGSSVFSTLSTRKRKTRSEKPSDVLKVSTGCFKRNYTFLDLIETWFNAVIKWDVYYFLHPHF